MTLTAAQLDAILDAIIATGGPLDPAATWFGVAQGVTDNGQDTVLADLTPATGAAATRLPITAWGTKYRLADGRHVVDGPVGHFAVASSGEAQTVAVSYLASALTAGVLKGFDMLAPAVNLPDASVRLALVVRVTVDPLGRWSANVQWNG